MASSKIEGSLQGVCETLKLSEATYNAAKKVLKQDSFLFSEFCLHYDDIYIMCSAVVISFSQTNKGESSNVLQHEVCSRFKIDALILEKLIYNIRTAGSFWFPCKYD